MTSAKAESRGARLRLFYQNVGTYAACLTWAVDTHTVADLAPIPQLFK